VTGCEGGCNETEVELVPLTFINPCPGSNMQGSASFYEGIRTSAPLASDNGLLSRDVIGGPSREGEEDLTNGTIETSILIPIASDDAWEGDGVSLHINIVTLSDPCRTCCQPECGALLGQPFSSILLTAATYDDMIDILTNDIELELRCVCSSCL
jgi:hypothetical protein